MAFREIPALFTGVITASPVKESWLYSLALPHVAYWLGSVPTVHQRF